MSIKNYPYDLTFFPRKIVILLSSVQILILYECTFDVPNTQDKFKYITTLFFQILYTFCFAPKTWDLTPQYAEQIYQRTNGLASKSTHSAKSRKYDTI